MGLESNFNVNFIFFEPNVKKILTIHGKIRISFHHAVAFVGEGECDGCENTLTLEMIM